MAAYIATLVVSDYALAFVPGLQIVMLLMFILAKSFRWYEALLVVISYSVIDSMIYGGVSLFTLAMIIGWASVVLLIGSFKRLSLPGKLLAKLSLFTSFMYTVPFLILSAFLFQIDMIEYLIADFPFTLGIALSSYLTIDLFYDKIIKRIETYTTKHTKKQKA